MPFFHDERDWFFQKRYGMFIHWGLYSIAGYHEQEIFRKGIARKEYEAYANRFNPVRFNAEQWLDLLQQAGMEYVVFTTKHLDGFCMWDTKYTDFSIMNTPYGKDILKELADACHRRNIPLLLYYCIIDTHHPNYPNQGRAYEYPCPQEGDSPNLPAYIEYVRGQVRELCTNYGKISGFFWDANIPGYYDESINDMIRELQPSAVINGRGFDEGDYNTPEREFEEQNIRALRHFKTPTEACQSLGMQSWGYREEEDYYSTKYIMQCIDRTLSMGGNYLLNVGPRADGTIDPRSADRLLVIAHWFQKVKESYYNAVPASDPIQDPGLFATVKGTDVYLHLWKDAIGDSIEVVPLTSLPESAILLNTGQELICKRDQGNKDWRAMPEYVRIRNIPVERCYDQVLVIKLTYRVLPMMFRSIEVSLTPPVRGIQGKDF